MLRLLIDESVDYRITDYLDDSKWRWSTIVKDSPGISDKEVLQRAHKTESILVTEDSDFGEWIFVHHYQSIEVIFLRYHTTELQKVGKTLHRVVEKYGEDLYQKYVVVTANKIRIREL